MILNWLRKKLMDRRRAIFSYWDGQRIVRDDPMKLHRRLLSHDTLDLESHIQLIDDDPECLRIVLEAIREVFGVQEYNPETGRGLTQEETVALLWQFLAYCNAKKKNANPSPTPPRFTDTKSSSPPSVDESDTKSSSVSGSTSAESKFDMPHVS